MMKAHVKLERSALVSRYEFDNRVRQSQESVTDYVKALKHLASYCKFKDEMRNERLRDPFIAGIRNDRMLRLMLAEKLTEIIFDSAVKKCITIEQISKDVETLQGGVVRNHPDAEHTAVRYVSSRPTHRCYRCAGNHPANKFPFKGATCYACQKIGHIQQARREVIRAYKKQTTPNDSKRLLRKDRSKSQRNSHTVNVVKTRQQKIDDESSDDSYNHNQNLSTLFQLKGNKAITVDVTIEEKP